MPEGFPLCGPLIRQALFNENIKEVRYLLELKCDPNHESPLNQVYFIPFNHGFEAVKLLLEYKADPNCGNDGWVMATMDCAMLNKPDILQFLIQHKADINLQSLYGRTCLDYAIARENMDCSMLLLKHGGKRVRNVENEFVANIRKDFKLLVIDQVLQWTNIQPRDVIAIIVHYACECWEI